MNISDEIKEIREYVACPQFGDDHYGQWGILRFDQIIKIKQLLDYITDLQEEKDYYLKKSNEISILNTSLRSDRDNYKTRNEKAIEYINNGYLSDGEMVNILARQDLLNILQGKSDE